MISQHWSADAALIAQPAHAAARARADSLMAWGHAAALAGGLAAVLGGLGLVASGALSPFVVALLFTAPVGGMLASGLLYAAAWRTEARDQADA